MNDVVNVIPGCHLFLVLGRPLHCWSLCRFIYYSLSVRWDHVLKWMLSLTLFMNSRYIHLRRKLEANRDMSEEAIQRKLLRSIYKHVMCKHTAYSLERSNALKVYTATWGLFCYHEGLSPTYCGTLPFAFLSWFTYSMYLVGKLAVIFTSEIPAFMTNEANSNCKYYLSWLLLLLFFCVSFIHVQNHILKILYEINFQPISPTILSIIWDPIF